MVEKYWIPKNLQIFFIHTRAEYQLQSLIRLRPTIHQRTIFLDTPRTDACSSHVCISNLVFSLITTQECTSRVSAKCSTKSLIKATPNRIISSKRYLKFIGQSFRRSWSTKTGHRRCCCMAQRIPLSLSRNLIICEVCWTPQGFPSILMSSAGKSIHLITKQMQRRYGRSSLTWLRPFYTRLWADHVVVDLEYLRKSTSSYCLFDLSVLP